ncbi:ABC transporter permease [Oscillospiraceae bacterium PP1C4]
MNSTISKSDIKNFFKLPATLAFVTMLIIWAASNVLIPGFGTFKHNATMLQTSAYLGFIVIGQAIVVITGGIDMSVSSIVTLSSVVASACVQHGFGTTSAILAALACSMLVGLVNATCINFLRIPPIIMTIAMMSLVEGVLLVMTNGTPPSGCSEGITFLSKGTPLGLPNVIWIWILFLAVFIWVVNKSKFGRYFYAIGSNENTAKLSGVNVFSVKYMAYLISGLCSGFAGVMILGNIGNTYLTIGTPYQAFSISAVVIGGISISGGKGKYAGLIAGTMLVIILRDILNVLSISPAGREVFQGVLILLVLLAYGREKLTR